MRHGSRAYRSVLERFRAKWIPVRVKKTRQNKILEPRSDSIGTEQALGNVEHPAEAGDAPDFPGDAISEYFGGVPDILEPDVKRCKTKPHDVGRPEITDHAAFD